METSVSKRIDAPCERVWGIITDIEGSPDVIQGISKVEVLERPESGLEGLKWRETRTMFGKEATEVMWITDVVANTSYRTRAESHGSVYVSTMELTREGDGCVLSASFSATPQTFSAKLMWALTGFMFRGSTRKAFEQDLDDIKRAAESTTAKGEPG